MGGQATARQASGEQAKDEGNSRFRERQSGVELRLHPLRGQAGVREADRRTPKRQSYGGNYFLFLGLRLRAAEFMQ